MLKKKYDEVKKAEWALQAELDNIEKHNKMDNKERKKQIRHLTSRKTQTGKQIMEKIGDIWEKALELSGIIQKMKTYDIGEDILQRWEGENERLLKKLDEDEKTALDVSDVNLEQE